MFFQEAHERCSQKTAVPKILCALRLTLAAVCPVRGFAS